MRRHPYRTAVIALALIGVVVAGVTWWLDSLNYESTDDAFIDARTATISSEVTGRIIAVPVTDNQLVHKGAVLVEVDARDYRAAVQQAQGQLEQATAAVADYAAQIEAQQARIDQAQKQITQAQASLTFAQEQAKRAQDLLARGAGTVQQAQQTASTLRQDQATLEQMQANRVAAQKQVPVLEAQKQGAVGQVDQAQGRLAQAKANLDRTEIRAPEAGRAAAISAAVGMIAQPGQGLMMFVPETVWVTANFKETELAHMHPGDPVEISIDAYPRRTFAGHVASIQPGSGAAFSLLPPENATGNFVKVVQRVPVKIVFNEPPDVYLGPGMSVVPSVKVR